MPKRNSTNGKGRLTPAFSYIRMSSDKQDTSPDQQRAEISTLAEQHCCNIIREYSDLGISGDATEKRTDFQQMIADCEAAGVGAILCYDMDRFGRFDSIEAGHWIYPLRKQGIRLITCAQGVIDWSDFTGRVMYTIQQEGKHQYLHDLARNTGRGLLAARRDGRWTGHPPFGYRIGPAGHLVFGPAEEVAVVREVFARRARGDSYFTIAKWLNESGIKPPRAAKWERRLVKQLLARRTYLGHVPTGENPQAKYCCMVDEPEYVEDAHPAIVDQDVWDIVQAMGQRVRRAHTRGDSRGAPLAGLLRCGRCQGTMYSTRHRRRQGLWEIYLCGTYKRGDGCGHCHIPQDATLSMVADAIRKHVLRGSLDRLEAAIQRQLDRRSQRSATDTGKIRREIKALDRKLDRAASRILEVDDSLVPRIEAQMLELTKRRETLGAELKAASQPPKTGDAKKIAAKLWELDDILSKADPVVVRESLSRIVDRIVLDFEPAGRNKRGRRFAFAGGRIELLPQGGHWTGRMCAFGTKLIRLTQADLQRAAG